MRSRALCWARARLRAAPFSAGVSLSAGLPRSLRPRSAVCSLSFFWVRRSSLASRSSSSTSCHWSNLARAARRSSMICCCLDAAAPSCLLCSGFFVACAASAIWRAASGMSFLAVWSRALLRVSARRRSSRLPTLLFCMSARTPCSWSARLAVAAPILRCSRSESLSLRRSGVGLSAASRSVSRLAASWRSMSLRSRCLISCWRRWSSEAISVSLMTVRW